MAFKSYTFVFFLIISLLCYYLVPKKRQWIFLLLSNIFFYVFSGPLNFVFIVLTSATTFFGATKASAVNSSLKQKKAELEKEDFKIEKSKATTKKHWILACVLFITLGVLGFLKYWNAIVLFLDSKLSADISFLLFNGNKSYVLPLGISFYTFQSISYFMDVYNGKYENEKSFPRYFLFVSFFPQLVMGPINRYDNLGAQLKEEHDFDFENIKHGVMLVLFGAMKKYCIADMLVNRISAIFDHSYTNLPGALIILSIVMFSIYQYADFSGGIDMCMGFAKMFGIEMQPNFRQPYFATSLADFWRRWHISLGLWMKDYVFYPLAFTKRMQSISKFFMNRKSAMGKHLARTIPAGIGNLVVFLLVGIWHGPEMHFVLWGLYNGLVIALSDFFKPAFEKINSTLRIPTKSIGHKIFQIVRTFIIVNIGAYFDRIVNVKESFLYLKLSVCNFGNIKEIFSQKYLKYIFGSLSTVESEIVLIFSAGLIVFVTSILRERKVDVYAAIQKKNIVFRWGAFYVLLILVILAQSFAPDNPIFMYAQY